MPSRIALLLLLAIVGACGPSYRMALGLAEYSGLMPTSFRMGDTIQVYASEWEQRAYETEGASASSGKNPADFSWESSNPAIVKVIGPGLLVMTSGGVATLHVSGPKTSASVRLAVFPEGAAIRLLPRDPTINVGETLSLEVAALDQQGAEFARLAMPEAQVWYRLPVGPQADPVLQQLPGWSFQFLGRKSGSDSVHASAEIHRGPLLRDGIRVVVR